MTTTARATYTTVVESDPPSTRFQWRFPFAVTFTRALVLCGGQRPGRRSWTNSLGEREARPSVSGFVFFPEGEYSSVRGIAVERLTGAERDFVGPMVKPATD